MDAMVLRTIPCSKLISDTVAKALAVAALPTAFFLSCTIHCSPPSHKQFSDSFIPDSFFFFFFFFWGGGGAQWPNSQSVALRSERSGFDLHSGRRVVSLRKTHLLS